MGILTNIKRLFGEGEIVAEVVLESGRVGTARAEFVGNFREEVRFGFPTLKNKIKAQVYLEYGERVKSIEIIGY